MSDTGVTGVCNWGVLENGVYWEECYCSQDECNAADSVRSGALAMILALCAVMNINVLL